MSVKVHSSVRSYIWLHLGKHTFLLILCRLAVRMYVSMKFDYLWRLGGCSWAASEDLHTPFSGAEGSPAPTALRPRSQSGCLMRGETGKKKIKKKRVTKEQQAVDQCFVHQYINTLLLACTEIIFIRHCRLRRKHPIQLIGLSQCHQFALREAELQEWRGDKGYIRNIMQGKKTPQSPSFGVSQGCDVCSIKAAPTCCRSSRRAFHRCISHRPLESVSHCHHSPTGTIILGTKEQKKKRETGGFWNIQSAMNSGDGEQMSGMPLCAHNIPPFGSVSCDLGYFWLCPF